MKQMKRLIALLLVAALSFSLVPLTAFAEEETEPTAFLNDSEAEEPTEEAESQPEESNPEEPEELVEQPEDEQEEPEMPAPELPQQEEITEGAAGETEQPNKQEVLAQILPGTVTVSFYTSDGVGYVRVSNGTETRILTEEAFYAYPGTECYRGMLSAGGVDEEGLENESSILSTLLLAAPTVKWSTTNPGKLSISSLSDKYHIKCSLYKVGADQNPITLSTCSAGMVELDFRQEIARFGSGTYYAKVLLYDDWGTVVSKVGQSNNFKYTVPSRQLAKPAYFYQNSEGIYVTILESADYAISFAYKNGQEYVEQLIYIFNESFGLGKDFICELLGMAETALYFRIQSLSRDINQVRSSDWTEWIPFATGLQAEDTIGTQIPGTKEIPVRYSESDNGTTVGTENIAYSDTFFSKDPATYSNKLAMISLGATMAATTIGSSKNKTVKYNGDGLIREFLQNIGIDDNAIRTYKFDNNHATDDTAGYALGIKQLSDGSYLLPVFIRSSGYGPGFAGEWASNFRVYGGAKGYSKGFKSAADGVYSGLKSYLAELDQVGIGISQIKFWIAGFSRGGAVANLVAAELNKRGDISKSNIFAYCFATPAVAEKAKVSAYSNIHNIMSQQDVVPRVPLYEWNYSRNGQQHFLPSVSDSSKYRNQMEKMVVKFTTIMNHQGRSVEYQVIEGQEIAIDLLMDYFEDIVATPYSYSASGIQGGLVKLLSKEHDAADLVDEILQVIVFSGSDSDKYQQVVSYINNFGNYSFSQKIRETTDLVLVLASPASAGEIALAEFAASYALRITADSETFGLLNLSKNYDHVLSMLFNLKDGQSSKLLMQHWPEAYLAWLRTNSETGNLFTKGHKITSVKCPVDVEVYDSTGILVCRIVDDVMDESLDNAIYAYVELNGEKVLYLPEDETYTVVTTAREEGTVSFTTTDYDPEGTRGDTTVFVNETMVEHQLFTMVDNTVTTNGVTLTPDITYTGEVIMTASAQVIGNGMVSGTGDYCLGDTVFLYAMQSGADEFVAWLDADGKLLSTENYYSYLALENTTVTAIFAENPGVTLDRSYLAMAENESADLDATVLPEQLSAYLTWSVEPADKDETTVITIDAEGTVTAHAEGTAYAVATVDLGGKVYTDRCRVDVSIKPVSEVVTGVGLGQNSAAVSLFSTNYAEIPLILEMDRISGILSNVLLQEPAEGNGHSVTAVRFDPDSPNGAAAAAVFNPVMKDDRTLQLIPTNAALLEGETGKLAAKYIVRLIVTVDGVDFTTSDLTISLTQTKPSVKAAAVKLNAFAPGIPAALTFTGGAVTAIELSPGSTLPDWLVLDTEAKTIAVSAENPASSYTAGKVNLLATVAGWAIRVPVSISYSFANKKPAVKFSTKTLTVTPATLDTASASFAISPVEFTDGEKYPVSIAAVTETVGRTNVPCETTEGTEAGESLWLTDCGILRLVLERNTVTVHAEQLEATEAARNFVINLAVCGSTFPLKLKVNPAKSVPTIAVKASGAIDTTIPNSPVTLKLTAKNYHLGSGEGYQLQLTERVPETGELLEADELFVRRDVGNAIILTQAEGAELNPKHAYAVVVLADLDGDGIHETFAKEVKLTVKTSDPAKVVPAVTLKASGSLDVIRAGGAITVTPAVKNCYGYTLQAADLKLYTVNGKVYTPVAEEENPFTVTVEDGAYVIAILDRDKINHTVKYAVRYEAELNGVPVLSGKAPTNISVKMGGAKFSQSTKQVNLYREDRYGTGEIILTAAQTGLTGIARVELDAKSAEFFAIHDLGNGKFSIGFRDNVIQPGAKPVTASLAVYLKGNQSTKPNGTIKVKINLLNTK